MSPEAHNSSPAPETNPENQSLDIDVDSQRPPRLFKDIGKIVGMVREEHGKREQDIGDPVRPTRGAPSAREHQPRTTLIDLRKVVDAMRGHGKRERQ